MEAKAKALWLAEGDKNTAFFHAKANERKIRKEVRPLRDDKGLLISDLSKIRDIVQQYFGVIFRSTRPSESVICEAVESMEGRVTIAVNESLLRPFVEDEITIALKHMHPLKSPGPDGMPPLFYQKYWSIISPSVSSRVSDVLNKFSLDPLINFTHIVLIPKCPNLDNMSQFRPISLCNVVYKLISKVLANRLKPFLESIISSSQSAFIPGRLITDNVLVAYEINHYLSHKRQGKVGFASLKLDISKAYDRVE
ncbi:UNVERIFIED_CONTAM: Retrovirus-related Pol polyprotein from type-1 retrotransposable element R2 [Sesamum latifolium]|uniref:Retrovirus-related Pol polyprotein from type-1 retrotransposable element R2 n=1 Tax=Sesamum latifolium TaxID=2727402 RepID=A0AAW2YB13_9LAMI